MADGDDRDENENSHKDRAANGVPDPQDIPNMDDLNIEDEESNNIDEEYLALDSQLDQLDACLDNLEARNDDLVSKLRALLEDSVLVRQELHQLNIGKSGDGGDDRASEGGAGCGESSSGGIGQQTDDSGSN